MDITSSIAKETKRTLIYLPAGIVTTPRWLFNKFTTASLAKHGIRKVIPASSNSDEIYSILVNEGRSRELVMNITADTPIMYRGWKKWGGVEYGQ